MSNLKDEAKKLKKLVNDIAHKEVENVKDDYLFDIKQAKESIKDYKIDIGGDEILDDTEPDEPTASVMKNRSEVLMDLLNNVGPGMCLAKWYNVSMHLTHGWTHSCYHPTSHKIPLKELAADPSALHNTEHKKKQRALMLNKKRPKECEYCWAVEDQPGNQMSDRPYRTQDVFTYNRFKEAISKNPLVTNFNPSYVEVNFNHACNLKCSYCSPHLSSSWMDEVEKYGGYKVVGYEHNSPDWLSDTSRVPLSGRVEENPYLKAFWDWWPEMYKTLNMFRMTGGEPLIDLNTFKVLDYVYKNPKFDLEIGITTNLVPPKKMWKRFIEKTKLITDNNCIEHFMLFVSVDATGKQAEYIRDGLDYELLVNNVDDYFANITDRHSISFINSFNALSLTTLKEYLQWILDLREKYSTTRQLIWFDTPYLHDPKWQSIRVLTSDYQKYIVEAIEFMKDNLETKEKRFHGFKDYEVDRMERNLEWMKTSMEESDLNMHRANFYRFFAEHDYRRNTDFLKTFPEMEEFWNLCKSERDLQKFADYDII